MKLKNLIAPLMLAAAISAGAADAPKYIFYMIGDGMGWGPTQAAEAYNRMALGNTEPLTMLTFPVVGVCQTYSASSPVTDSAAAGTALATGYKTNNGMLGVTPDSTAVNSVAHVLKNEGWGVGLVTSVAFDDATPGAFYAHVPNRNMYSQIGLQAAQSGYEFMCGGGMRGEYQDGKPTDLMEIMAEYGVTVVRGKEQLEQTMADRVLLFNPEDIHGDEFGYAIDSIAGALELSYVTEACIKHLERVSPDRFFMMVEGGAIDHALHGNDGGAAIKDLLAFNQAIDVAYEFYKQHPDETLIVVTADHDTGGMSVGNAYLGYNAKPKYIDYQKVSKSQFSNYCKSILRSRRTFTWDDMREYLTDNLGFWRYVPIKDKEETSLKAKFETTFELRNSEDQKTMYDSFNAFAAEVFRIFNDHCGFGYTTTHHSGNSVPVCAVGVGAERFVGLQNNVDIPRTILQIVNQ